MHRHRRNVLLLIAGVALSIALGYAFDFHKLFLAWFWSIEETLKILGFKWFSRRLGRFVTTPLFRFAIIFGPGFGAYGRFKRWALSPLVRFHRWVLSLWLISWPYRIASALVALAIIAFFGWITWLKPWALPLTGWIIGKLYWWVSDQFVDRTLYAFRWRQRLGRIQHNSKLVQFIAGPYWLLRRSMEERLETAHEKRNARRKTRLWRSRPWE